MCVGGSPGIVAYPHIEHEALREGHGELRERLSPIFRMVVFLFLPITLFSIFNALPIVRLLYEHGVFNPLDSIITSQALALYAMGIFPNAIAIVLLRCFSAIHDTVTLLWAELVTLGLYVVAAPLMAHRFGIQG